VTTGKGQPLTVRLAEATRLLVEREARRTSRSRGAIVGELAEEAAKARLFPGIAFRGPEPRRPWIVGSGLDVWEIVSIHRDYGGDLKKMLAGHQSLSERAVRLALAYAEGFPDEVEEAIALNTRPVGDWLEELPTAGVTRASRRG
jgi:uncharacterized protein (DUF433 family)